MARSPIPAVDVFDREAVFLTRVLAPLMRRHPGLKIVLEHVTTREAVAFVSEAGPTLAATITAHHLVINRNALFAGGLRPHAYCLPVAKREEHRLALRRAAVSGDAKFFLGTDTAPHPVHDKERDCGCAGIFSRARRARNLRANLRRGRRARPARSLRLAERPALLWPARRTPSASPSRASAWRVPDEIATGAGPVRPFLAGEEIGWRLA